jgi:hypothetical protein
MYPRNHCTPRHLLRLRLLLAVLAMQKKAPAAKAAAAMITAYFTLIMLSSLPMVV